MEKNFSPTTEKRRHF